jgi:hypothetical protein
MTKVRANNKEENDADGSVVHCPLPNCVGIQRKLLQAAGYRRGRSGTVVLEFIDNGENAEFEVDGHHEAVVKHGWRQQTPFACDGYTNLQGKCETDDKPNHVPHMMTYRSKPSSFCDWLFRTKKGIFPGTTDEHIHHSGGVGSR